MAGRNHGESSGPRAAQLPQASGALGSLPHPGQTAPPITPTLVCPRPPLQTGPSRNASTASPPRWWRPGFAPALLPCAELKGH